MKINLSRIALKTLDGEEQQVDIKKQFCDFLYCNSMTLQELELALRLYHSSNDEGEDVTDEEAKIIIDNAKKMKYVYIIRQAIAETLELKEWE